jgi:pre-mRNA-splicing factor ATP-dependent RNA helicase DHX38/PRP16
MSFIKLIVRWLADLGPMFYVLKEHNFTSKERRIEDKKQTESMEEELRIATERMKAQEASSNTPSSFTPRSRIVTPGRKSGGTPRRRPF